MSTAVLTIINPFAGKAERELNDARVMDTKNLARNLLIQSMASESGISAEQAFVLAEKFMAEQTRRYPKHDTIDGKEKSNV